MYKTISINTHTYQQLNAIAARLDKPKSRVIEELIQQFVEHSKAEEKKKLDKFNQHMHNLASKIRLPKGTRVNTYDIDKDFAALKESDYI